MDDQQGCEHEWTYGRAILETPFHTDQAAEAEIRTMAFETRTCAKCEEEQWRQEAGSGEWITQ
jgi:hypothetical protein